MVRTKLWSTLAFVVAISTSAAVSASVSSAKVLPIESVRVTTARPTVRQPIAVELRFIGGGNLGDYAWENLEVYVLPAALTDANGWPVRRGVASSFTYDANGQPQRVSNKNIPIELRLQRDGVYRGQFSVEVPGDYVVLDQSAVLARSDPAVNLVRPTAVPVRVHVAAAPATSTAWWPWLVVGGAILAVLVFVMLLPRRSRSRTPPAVDSVPVPEAPALVDVP